MSSTNSDNSSTYYLAIAAGKNYTHYDKVQCQLFLQPILFSVNVSATDLSITVQPDGEAEDPEPRGLLRSTIMDALNTISMVQTTLYVSALGDALKANLENYRYRLAREQSQNGGASVRQDGNEDVLRAIEQSVEAMSDDILLSFASAALTRSDSVSTSQISYTAIGIDIGEYAFVLAVAICHILALVGIIISALVFGLWTSTPAFDYADIGSMSTAVRLASHSYQRTEINGLQHWRGEADNSKIAQLFAQYDKSTMSDQRPSVRITDVH